jgi:hypothetical protein
MYDPRHDVTHNYRYVETDFVKHLLTTTLVIAVLAVILSALFREPVRPALKIDTFAQAHPVLFEKVAIGDINGQGSIADYGPPYNNGTGSLQDPVQKFVGVIHPVNTERDFVVRPLEMAAHLDPSIRPALARWKAAPRSQQIAWANAYLGALDHARVSRGRVLVAPGPYGPVSAMMRTFLSLGQSGLLSGALNRSSGDYAFNSMNSLLFMQGRPLHLAAGRLELLGNQWGIIHEENAPYPGPWWMTIVTAIYQIPYIANASAGDALALGLGLILFVLLMVAPWIPGVNRLPRYLGLYRLIWRSYYDERRAPTEEPS